MDKVWNPLHHPAVTKANKDLADFDAKHGKEKLASIVIVFKTYIEKLYLPITIFNLRCWAKVINKAEITQSSVHDEKQVIYWEAICVHIEV